MRQLLFIIALTFSVIAGFAQNKEELQNSYNYQRGYELLFGDNPDQNAALEFLKKEVADHPKNGYALYLMGLIYDQNDQEGNALDCFNKAVSLLKKDKKMDFLCLRASRKSQHATWQRRPCIERLEGITERKSERRDYTDRQSAILFIQR